MIRAFVPPTELTEFLWDAAQVVAAEFEGEGVTPFMLLGKPEASSYPRRRYLAITTAKGLLAALLRRHVWCECDPRVSQGRPIRICIGFGKPPFISPAPITFPMIAHLLSQSHTAIMLRARLWKKQKATIGKLDAELAAGYTESEQVIAAVKFRTSAEKEAVAS